MQSCHNMTMAMEMLKKCFGIRNDSSFKRFKYLKEKAITQQKRMIFSSQVFFISTGKFYTVRILAFVISGVMNNVGSALLEVITR